MVVPPKHPKWWFFAGKPWLLGSTILGSPSIFGTIWNQTFSCQYITNICQYMPIYQVTIHPWFQIYCEDEGRFAPKLLVWVDRFVYLWRTLFRFQPLVSGGVYLDLLVPWWKKITQIFLPSMVVNLMVMNSMGSSPQQTTTGKEKLRY